MQAIYERPPDPLDRQLMQSNREKAIHQFDETQNMCALLSTELIAGCI